MKFNAFQEGNISQYIDSNLDHSFWLFQHIPKTAGSSLVAECNKHLSSYKNLHVGLQSTPHLSHPEKMDLVIEDFCKSKGNCQIASGHLRKTHVDSILSAYPNTKLFTYVRHPVKRVISAYYYSLSNMHSSAETFKQKFPTLEDYAKHPISQNQMTFFLNGSKNIKPDDLINFVFNRFSFIGIQDIYPLSFKVLSTLLWNTSKPNQVQVRKNTAKKEANPETFSLIMKNNRLDMKLYKAVQNTYITHRDELHSIINQKKSNNDRKRSLL